MIRSVSILGSTGSIGKQSLRAAEGLDIRVEALAVQSNISILEEQIRRYRPRFAAVYDEKAADRLRLSVRDLDLEIGSGMEGLCRAAAMDNADAVVTAVSGSVGLQPTLCAIEAKKRICLANKETLVCAGSLVMRKAAEFGAQIVPVDSEHSAVFQCLEGRREQLSRILLTGSGGPFRTMPHEMLSKVTPEQAVKHPNWSMGAKISVDSATLMNKGLELIEAMHLFSVPPQDIQVVIHPQSVIHSMVELTDGTVLAQLAVPDMELPIRYAMTWPERRISPCERLDFRWMKDLTFEEPRLDDFPCLALAMRCAREGGAAPCVMSAANEESVALFLQHRIGFTDIYTIVSQAVDSLGNMPSGSLAEILEADHAARGFVHKNMKPCS